MKLRTMLALASMTMIGAAACDAGNFVTGSELVEVAVQVSAELASLSVSGVSVEVTGPGIETPIVGNLPITDGVASGSVQVLAGSDRAFSLRAYDLQGVATHEGADTVDIAGSGTTSLNVSLAPIVGGVNIGARIGDYAVTVSPATPTVTAGGTVQLQATVVDAYGDTVQTPAVTWGSLNPAVASVDSMGLVGARVAGQTTIAANYRGFAGSTVVTVQ